MFADCAQAVIIDAHQAWQHRLHIYKTLPMAQGSIVATLKSLQAGTTYLLLLFSSGSYNYRSVLFTFDHCKRPFVIVDL